MRYLVHLVLHPHGIALTFLTLGSWLPLAGFHPENKSDKEWKIAIKNLSFMYTNSSISYTCVEV